MNNFFNFIFLLLLFGNQIFSQTNNQQELNDAYYREASQYYQKKEYQSALIFLDKISPWGKREEDLKELIFFKKNHSIFTDNYPKNYAFKESYYPNAPTYEQLLLLKIKNFQSIGTYTKALSLLKFMLQNPTFSKYKISIELAETFKLQGKIDSAKTYYREAFTFSKNLEDSIQVYIGLGSSFLFLNQPDSSYYYFDNALGYFQKKDFQSLYLEQEIYNQLGRLSAITRKFEDALGYYQKAIQVSKQFQQNKNPLLARHYYGLSQVYKYYEVYNIDSSLYYAQKALVFQIPSFNEVKDLYQNPDTISELDGLNGILYLSSKIWILWLKYKYTDIKKTQDLQAVINTALHTLEIIETYESYLKTQSDKLLLARQAMRVCKQGEMLSQIASNDSLIIFFAEKVKAYILKTELIKQNKDNIDDFDIYSLANIQKHLAKHEGMLLYSFPQTSGTYDLDKLNIIFIDKESFKVIQRELPTDFNDIIKEYRYSIEGNNRQDFIKTANYLYQILIPSIEELSSNKKKLIIIPDGRLLQIPFEALLTQNVLSSSSYTKLPYLLRDLEISYHYSASLWLYLKEKENSFPKNDLLAFAPVFNGEPNYMLSQGDYNRGLRMIDSVKNKYLPLLASKDEVLKTHQIFEKQGFSNSLVFLNQVASETNFKAYCPDYRFLHLATHSLTDLEIPAFSHVVFSPDSSINQEDDGRLYLEEIYNLDLNTKLVTLSSCESGLGKLVKGEGMLSLARAFLYAGSQGVLFSLWKVSDKASKDFMITFYGYLLDEEMTFSQALRQTRLDLLKTNPNPSAWTSFILVGE